MIAGVQKKNESMVRAVVGCDAGNRTFQTVDPNGLIHLYPSYYKEVDPDYEDVSPAPGSVLIEQKGKAFFIGKKAKEGKGKPVFKQGKIELAPKLVLAALIPNPGQHSLYVDRLLLTLPNSRNAEAVNVLKSLEGTHEFTRNGSSVIATVSKVVAIDEVVPAYTYAMQMGIFRDKSKMNGGVDIGGLTCNCKLFYSDGSINRDADLTLPGTAHLAAMIGARINRFLEFTPDDSVIMDGIERGFSAGDTPAPELFTYGEGGLNFYDAFTKAHKQWVDELWNEIKSRWGQWARVGEIGEVILLGGSAPLLQPLVDITEGRFKQVDNPQTFSIRGMESL